MDKKKITPLIGVLFIGVIAGFAISQVLSNEVRIVVQVESEFPISLSNEGPGFSPIQQNTWYNDSIELEMENDAGGTTYNLKLKTTFQISGLVPADVIVVLNNGTIGGNITLEFTGTGEILNVTAWSWTLAPGNDVEIPIYIFVSGGHAAAGERRARGGRGRRGRAGPLPAVRDSARRHPPGDRALASPVLPPDPARLPGGRRAGRV